MRAFVYRYLRVASSHFICSAIILSGLSLSRTDRTDGRTDEQMKKNEEKWSGNYLRTHQCTLDDRRTNNDRWIS